MRWTVWSPKMLLEFGIQGSSEMRWTVYITGVSQNVAGIWDSGSSEMRWTVHISGVSKNMAGFWDSREF